jgi:hypothetical protein
MAGMNCQMRIQAEIMFTRGAVNGSQEVLPAQNAESEP